MHGSQVQCRCTRLSPVTSTVCTAAPIQTQPQDIHGQDEAVAPGKCFAAQNREASAVGMRERANQLRAQEHHRGCDRVCCAFSGIHHLDMLTLCCGIRSLIRIWHAHECPGSTGALISIKTRFSKVRFKSLIMPWHFVFVTVGQYCRGGSRGAFVEDEDEGSVGERLSASCAGSLLCGQGGCGGGCSTVGQRTRA